MEVLSLVPRARLGRWAGGEKAGRLARRRGCVREPNSRGGDRWVRSHPNWSRCAHIERRIFPGRRFPSAQRGDRQKQGPTKGCRL